MPAESSGWRRFRPLTAILAAACVLLSLFVVLLARQNLALKRQLNGNLSPSSADELRPGDRLGSLLLVDEQGASLPLEFDSGGERTLLLVFSSSCPACQRTLPQWERLLAGVSAGAPRVLGVQVDFGAVPEEIGFPLFHVDRSGSAALKQLPFVPATVLLNAGGAVERVWFGVLGDEEQRELSAWLAMEPADSA